jgi:hypothetical protein
MEACPFAFSKPSSAEELPIQQAPNEWREKTYNVTGSGRIFEEGSNSTQFSILPCHRKKRKAAENDGDGDDDGSERLTIFPTSLKDHELANLLPCPLRDARPAEYNGIRGLAFGGCHCGFKFISELE